MNIAHMVTKFQAVILKFNLSDLESDFFFASTYHYSAKYLAQKRFFLLYRQCQLSSSEHPVFKIEAF